MTKEQRMTLLPKVQSLLYILLLFITTPVQPTSIASLLKEKQPPAGVVFEIVSDEEDYLKQQLPTLNKDIERIRQRFPGPDIAIVTHGKEQFSLTQNNSKNEQAMHSLVKDMVNKNDIDMHVCGTHASWYGVTLEDFPDYVDVSSTGPAQINDYEALGYEVIVLTD